jgi:geranylgeranyl pyrophosphate synthase
MNDLGSFLESARARIDDALDRAVPPLGTPPPVLHEAMRYALLAPGKRLRGAVVLACCELLRGEAEDALPLACAVEMVHAASLVLDDLPCMDNATLRRGRPAVHRALGEANAILAAIALLNAAFEAIARAERLRPAIRAEMASRLARAIGAEGLVGGQVADLAATGTRLGLDGLEYIHSHKTGALFIAAAEIGALAASAKERDERALHAYAKNLGLAFQITDDLLDYSGSPEITGKDAGTDRDKTTFVDLCGIDGARRLVDELIDTAIAALASFGRRRERLVALAELVRARDR